MQLANSDHDNDSQNQTATGRQDAQWLSAHWMPFTGNRDFKARPRMIVSSTVRAGENASRARPIAVGCAGIVAAALKVVKLPNLAAVECWETQTSGAIYRGEDEAV